MAEHITYVPLPSDHRSDSTDNEGVVHNLVQLAKTQVETIKTQVETIKTQVVDWLNAHPTVKETLVAGGDILSTVLLFADLASDSILTADLFRADELLFGSMSVFLIINQFVAMDKAVHAFATRKASGGAQLAHLLAGFPFAPIFLDLALALNALRLLPADPRWDELIAQYKSTRSLLEVTLESAPQTLLQGVLFARFLLSDADGAGFQVPLQMLLISFTLSTINLLKAWIGAWFAARALELSLPEYLNLLLAMGKGLPLEQLRANAVDNCKLHALPLDASGVKVLATVLRNENTTLVHLDLWGSIVEPRGKETGLLAKAVVQHQTLKRARFDGAEIDVHQLRTAAEVDLRGKDIGAPATVTLVAAIVEANEQLRVLDVTSVELDSDAREKLRGAVRANVELRMDESAEEAVRRMHYAPLLKKLNMSMSELEAATELDASDKGLDDEDCVVLGELLKGNKTWKTLNLAHNKCGVKGGIAIAEALRVNAVMTACTLIQNKLDVESANMLAKIGTEKRIMLSGIKHNQTEADFSRQRLQPADGILIASDLRVSAALTNLDLSFNSIGNEGGIALAEVLKVNAVLTNLDLRNNRLDVEAGKALAEALRVNAALTTLDLTYNGLDAEAGKALASALKVNAALTSLNLHDNAVGPHGGKAFAEALRVNAVLTKLELRDNELDDAAKHALADAARRRDAPLALDV